MKAQYLAFSIRRTFSSMLPLFRSFALSVCYDADDEELWNDVGAHLGDLPFFECDLSARMMFLGCVRSYGLLNSRENSIIFTPNDSHRSTPSIANIWNSNDRMCIPCHTTEGLVAPILVVWHSAFSQGTLFIVQRPRWVSFSKVSDSPSITCGALSGTPMSGEMFDRLIALMPNVEWLSSNDRIGLKSLHQKLTPQLREFESGACGTG